MKNSAKKRTLKRYLFDTLQFNNKSKVTLAVNTLIITLILLSVPVDILESVPDVHPLLKRWGLHIDLIMTFVFGAEYVLRLIVCTEDPRFSRPFIGRLKYMLTPLMLIDLFAISPFFIFGTGAIRMMRIFRILMLARYTNAIELMNTVVSEKKSELAVCGAFVVMLWVWSSFMIYRVEHPVQPDVFKNMIDAMWWSLETFTTIGYGDLVPVTVIGRLITGITVAVGLVLFAIITAILTAGIIQELKKWEKKSSSPKI